MLLYFTRPRSTPVEALWNKPILGFIEFLEELEQNHKTITIPSQELERLAGRFGDRVRQMGFWNKTTDGSLEIAMNDITAAVASLDDSFRSGR